MKTKIIISTIILGASLFMASCGSSSNKKSNENTTEEVKTAEYQCPMKCEGEKMYDEPGTCPVCKMDLELISNSELHHHDH